MDSLRQAVIKLAHEKPEFRKHLIPILKESGKTPENPEAGNEKVLIRAASAALREIAKDFPGHPLKLGPGFRDSGVSAGQRFYGQPAWDGYIDDVLVIHLFGAGEVSRIAGKYLLDVYPHGNSDKARFRKDLRSRGVIFDTRTGDDWLPPQEMIRNLKKLPAAFLYAYPRAVSNVTEKKELSEGIEAIEKDFEAQAKRRLAPLGVVWKREYGNLSRWALNEDEEKIEVGGYLGIFPQGTVGEGGELDVPVKTIGSTLQSIARSLSTDKITVLVGKQGKVIPNMEWYREYPYNKVYVRNVVIRGIVTP